MLHNFIKINIDEMLVYKHPTSYYKSFKDKFCICEIEYEYSFVTKMHFCKLSLNKCMIQYF